jgi:hypothetical protein
MGIATALAVLLFTGAAQAQAARTWVSSSLGGDGNPCTRALPCIAFADAYAQTAAGGEIDVLDPGDYGSLVIQHAITIANDGVGTVAVTATIPFFIYAGSADAVILRGLEIESSDGLNSGVIFLGGGSLIVDHCNIHGFAGPAGIWFEPATVAKLWVTDSTLWANGSNPAGNIVIQPVLSGSATVLLERVRILQAIGNGVRADETLVNPGSGAMNVTLHDVVVDGSSSSGIVAVSAPSGGLAVNVMLDHVTVSNNVGFGIRAVGATATVRLSRSTVVNNTTGLGTSGGGALASYSDNFFGGNADGDGAPTGAIAPE